MVYHILKHIFKTFVTQTIILKKCFFELKIPPHIWNRRENDCKWKQENSIQWKLYRRSTKRLYTCTFFMRKLKVTLVVLYINMRVETIFIFFTKLSVKFYEMVLIWKVNRDNKSARWNDKLDLEVWWCIYSKQTNSSLCTIKCFYEVLYAWDTTCIFKQLQQLYFCYNRVNFPLSPKP